MNNLVVMYIYFAKRLLIYIYFSTYIPLLGQIICAIFLYWMCFVVKL